MSRGAGKISRGLFSPRGENLNFTLRYERHTQDEHRNSKTHLHMGEGVSAVSLGLAALCSCHHVVHGHEKIGGEAVPVLLCLHATALEIV